MANVIKKIKTTMVNNRINLQVLTSVDNGNTFHYCGVGKYANNLLQARIYLRELLT